MLHQYLDLLRIAIASSSLLYASYSDFKTREVSDKVWIISGIAGAVVNAFLFYLTEFKGVLTYLIGIFITGAIAFAIYFAGLYGGADAKALLMIALVDPFLRGSYALHEINGITVFSNGMLISAILPISMAAYNLKQLIFSKKRIFEGFENENKIRKLAAFFLGVRLRNSRGRKFWSPIEKRIGEDSKVFTFNISIEDFNECEYDDAWVTPGIPLIVFFTAGYFVSLFLGDLIAVILYSLARPSPLT